MYLCILYIIIPSINLTDKHEFLLDTARIRHSLLSNKGPLLNIKAAVQHSFNNNGIVPGAAGGSEELGSSSHPRHTQEREKNDPLQTNCVNI